VTLPKSNRPIENRLKGKTAIVTGAGSAAGIGFAVAERMAVEGANVILTDIDADAVTERAGELQSQGFNVAAFGHDIISEASWRDVFMQTISAYEAVDILVNNAGICILNKIEAMSLDDFRRQIEVNLVGAFLGCREAVGRMRSQGGGGSIVNVASLAAIVGMPGTAAYAASKGGIRQMSRSIALECARDDIRVNTVFPGITETGMQNTARKDNPGVGQSLLETVPLKRSGAPSEQASMIAFLASDDARYITGAEFIVDGGLSAQ